MTNKIIEAVLDEPVLLASVKVKEKWWKKAKTRDLYLKGATASTMYKITELLLSIRTTSKVQDSEGQIYDLMNANIKHVVRFIAIAIHNDKGTPPKWLEDALENQFSVEELKAMSVAAYRRLGIEPFFGIMGLLRNPELKMIDTPETTVLGQPSEVSSNTLEVD